MTGLIDVHHHLVPPAVAVAMERRGINKVAGAPLPKWSPQRSLAVMDMNGIESAILSHAAPGVYFGDRQEACDLARASNDYAAQLRDDNPSRFGFFAVLPMPFTDQSCREAAYALDTLGADGIVLLGSTDGLFLGDQRLDALMVELDRRKAVVFVHPNIHRSSDELGLATPGFMLEFLCDTTRAATNLIMTGTMETYPNIKWILAHAGGFLPYIVWRLSLGNLMADIAPNVPQGVLTYIRRFYFDTALSPSPYAMASLKELVDPSQILFGSDFPFAPEPLAATQIAALAKLDVWSGTAKAAICRSNALALFPRLAAGESAGVPQTQRRATRVQKMQNLVQRPMLAFAERLRNR